MTKVLTVGKCVIGKVIFTKIVTKDVNTNEKHESA